MTIKDPFNSPTGDASTLRSGRSISHRPEGTPASTPIEAFPAAPGESQRWNRRPMYAEFFGLRESPFDLTPDPRFLFLATRQREALSNLRYGLASSKGFTLLVGDAGTGKTTLVRTALGELGDTPHRYVLVNNPTLGRAEFYDFLAREFALSDEARTSKTVFLLELQREVEARFAAGGLTGLIIDEAQSMPYELLEEIRLLGNIETSTTKLLNIVLSGQPELADRLNEPSLRQLKQRVALRCELRALSLDEAAAYISGRLRIAGALPQDVFTRQTVIAIHKASAGIPRTINVLCDNALIGGFAAQVKPITLEIVEDVCRDFDLGGPAPEPAPVPDPGRTTPPRSALPAGWVRPGDASTGLAPATQDDQRPMFDTVNQKPKWPFSFFS